MVDIGPAGSEDTGLGIPVATAKYLVVQMYLAPFTTLQLGSVLDLLQDLSEL